MNAGYSRTVEGSGRRGGRRLTRVPEYCGEADDGWPRILGDWVISLISPNEGGGTDICSVAEFTGRDLLPDPDDIGDAYKLIARVTANSPRAGR